MAETIAADRRRVIIAANPFSGVRSNQMHVEGLVASLRRLDLDPQPVWTPDELDDALRAADDPPRCLVAAGGDGTVLMTLNRPGLAADLPFAAFPLGNENLLAAHIGYSNDPDRFARTIAAGHLRRIDLGRCNGRRFATVASAGFDGAVARCLDQWRRAHPGRLKRVRRASYALPLLRCAIGYPYPAMTVETDDGRFISGALVMVFNLPRYGLGLRLCDEAVDDDGLLDWIVFGHGGTARLAGYAAAVLLRRHRRLGDVTTGRCRSLRVAAGSPVPVEIDGDPFDTTPMEIAAEPAALPIVTPIE